MHLIAYTSVYSGAADDLDAAIESIIQSSKKNNPRLEITGVMFAQNGRFLQFLEGAEENVRSMMGKICKDSRHNEIKTLFDEPIESRGLADWNMDFFDMDDDQNVESEFLAMISDGYKQVLKTDTCAIVDVFKSFVSGDDASK